MAGVKKVEIVEGNTLAVTDCGQDTPTLYDIDCGCDDGNPSVPPPVQSDGTACNVASHVANKTVDWFAAFIPAMQAFSTANFWNSVQNAANTIGLGGYTFDFWTWISNLANFVGVNKVVQQYYGYADKRTDLMCWLLSSLGSTGEITPDVISAWRAKISAAKNDKPAYSAVLEAFYGFTSIIPQINYQQQALIGSTIQANCTRCASGACSAGIWADFRNEPDNQGWEAIISSASVFPFPSGWNMTQRSISCVRTSRGWEAPNCTQGQMCVGAGVVRTMATPIKLCSVKAWGTLWLGNSTGSGEENMHCGNTRLVALFYQTATNPAWQLLATRHWHIGEGEEANGDLGNQATGGVYATVEWYSGGTGNIPAIENVTKLAFTLQGGGSIGSVLRVQYNDNPSTAPTITGVPYVARPVITVPDNVSQAGWDAIHAVESAGRIYELGGTMQNVTITPRTGDAFRTKTGIQQAVFSGASVPTTWTLDLGTTYYATYSRTINKAGAGGNGLVDGIYQINDDALYPRAHWMIAVKYHLMPSQMLRHVATLADCRANTSTYFVDEGASRIYVNIAAPVVSSIISIAHTRNAFVIASDNVVIENLKFDLYAPNFQEGIIQTPSPLTIGKTHLLGCQVDWSACNGVKLGTGSHLHENNFGLSGMASIIVQGENVVVSGNVQTGVFNDQHTNEGYEGTWLKASRTRYALITNNTLKLGGDGKGLWDDLGCIYTVYQGNDVRNTSRAGIFPELGFGTQVLDNVVVDCRRGGNGQPQGAGILVANSQGFGTQRLTIKGNTVVNYGDGGGCWGVSQTPRGSTVIDGVTYVYLSKDIDVTENNFYTRDLSGSAVMRSGLYRSYDEAIFDTAAQGIVIDGNAYHHNHAQPFQRAGANQSDTQWKANSGGVFDPNSTFDSATVPDWIDA